MTPIAGPSGARGSYDYTEGASPIDINNALANSRRSQSTSELNVYNDDEGTMFSGPGHSANPSSVTRMSNLDPARRSWSIGRRKSRDSGVSGQVSLERRMSQDSQVSRQSNESDNVDVDAESGRNTFRGRRRRSPSPQARSVWASIFGKSQTAQGSRRLSFSSRRSSASLSRRSARSDAGSEHALDTDDEERWGYSSGEEDSEEEHPGRDDVSVTGSMEYDSEPPSPSMSQSLPLLSSDQIFGGETRIDMDFSFTEMEPPPFGPPSRQQVYVEDDDSTIRLVGYEVVPWRQWVWRTGCLLTLGILGLLGHWFPRLWLRFVTHEKAFRDINLGFVAVEVRSIHLEPVHILTMASSHPIKILS